MPTTAAAPVSEAMSSPPVDLEMLSESLIFQAVDLASEFECYAVDAVQRLLRRYHQTEDMEEALLDTGSRLWRWLQQKCRLEETEATKDALLLPLPQPAVFPLSLQHMDFITERFDDVNTQLQLIHAAVHDLQSKGEQTDSKLGCLQEQLRRVSPCRCKPRERCARCSLMDKFSNTKTNAQVARASSETPMLHLNRLEIPIEVVQAPTTLQEHSSAVLYWIVNAVDGSPNPQRDERDHGVSLYPLTNEMPSTATPPLVAQEILCVQGLLELQEGTSAGQHLRTAQRALDNPSNLSTVLHGRLSDTHEDVTEGPSWIENDLSETTPAFASGILPTDDEALLQAQEQHDTDGNQLDIFQLYQVTARENE